MAALAVLLVADIALVGLAMRSTSSHGTGPGRPAALGEGGAPGGSTPAASGTATSSATSSATSTPTGTAEAASPGPRPAPLTVGLVAVDAQRAWRFDTGSCPDGGSSLAVTEDGGATWVPRAAPFATTMRVRVRANGTVFAIGADQGCAPRFRQAEADVASWLAAGPVPGAWYRDPKTPTVVGTLAGTTAQPCGASAVVDLGVADDAAAALCADGRVARSTTGGEWSTVATAEGALALALAPERALVVLALPGCDGLAVADASAPDTALGCVPVKADALAPGTVALAARGADAWLVAGDAVLRSSGDLSAWSTAG